MATIRFSTTESSSGRRTGWVYLFDYRNRLLLWKGEDGCLTGLKGFSLPELEEANPGASAAEADAWVLQKLDLEISSRRIVEHVGPDGEDVLFFAALTPDQARSLKPGAAFYALETVCQMSAGDRPYLDSALEGHLPSIHAHGVEIPYLNFRKHDFVYKFRTERERNVGIYKSDAEAGRLYSSLLCQAIKETRRKKENASAEPATLEFGPVTYLLPSHFGFCLGVQNAIERAYETLAAHSGERVFMLSELIHNPFVNADLKRRGLKYLQTDKGEPVLNPETGRLFWEELSGDDIVVIPAFGATNEDKLRLIEKGIPLNEYDATCMLVEKVWKAAKRFGEAGFSVIIHGKSEHEETKATFSNSSKYAPSLVVRNLSEAKQLGAILLEADPERKRTLFDESQFPHTPGFDPLVDLERVAVVNQTTLLRNETLSIIRYLEDVMAEKFGKDKVREHVNGKSRGDTLCYATQVNQDALQRALASEVDVALVAGGKNSSNTFQLFRMCESKLGERAFYIQSEENILSVDRIRHFVFPYNPADSKQGRLEERPFLDPSDLGRRSIKILVTGGASCPDGIIQQIIERINRFMPEGQMRPIEAVVEAVREASDVTV